MPKNEGKKWERGKPLLLIGCGNLYPVGKRSFDHLSLALIGSQTSKNGKYKALT